MSGCITFVNVGRLGNNLFQCAAALAYSFENKMEFSAASTPRPGSPVYLQHLVNPRFNPSLPQIMIKEQAFCWQPLPFKESWRNHNIVLNGYWQSEKYFMHYSGRVIEAFGFKWELKPGLVSVHIRRGDYLTIKRNGMFKHPPVSKEWYERAMAKFPGLRFKFYSDDMPYCKEQWGWRTDCTFSDGADELFDLVDGSCAQHHIGSASTFSWWQCWLGRNLDKKVIFPNHWLTPGWDNLDFSDVVPKEWEKMP